MQSLFGSGMLTYLGKMSYGFVLLQGIVARVMGTVVQTRLGDIVNGTSEWESAAVFVLGGMASLMALVLAADAFSRVVDAPCVRICRWVDRKWSGEEKGRLRI